MRGHAIAGGALAVAVLTVGLMLGVSGSSDLERAEATICPDNSWMSDFSGGRQACTIVNTDQRDVTFGVVVRNSGPVGVTVTEFPLDTLHGVGFTPHEIMEGKPPFRLGRGEEQRIVLRGRLPDCAKRTTGGATTFTDLAFRVRAVGVSRNLSVPLDPTVRLVSERC